MKLADSRQFKKFYKLFTDSKRGKVYSASDPYVLAAYEGWVLFLDDIATSFDKLKNTEIETARLEVLRDILNGKNIC